MTTPLFCLNIFTGEGRAEFQAVHVPSARIKGDGAFKRVCKIMDGDEEIGQQTLEGKFSGAKATGTIETGRVRAGQGSFEVRSRLDASAEAVWQHATTSAGVNEELMPLVRMTVPRGLGDLAIADVEPGTRLGRSWLLLGGLIPFDYDDIFIESIEPGRAFHERSTMLTQRTWSHDRIVDPDGPSACTVTDRVRFEPRLGLLAPVLRPVFRRFFIHRHRRLHRRWGGRALP